MVSPLRDCREKSGAGLEIMAEAVVRSSSDLSSFFVRQVMKIVNAASKTIAAICRLFSLIGGRPGCGVGIKSTAAGGGAVAAFVCAGACAATADSAGV